MSALEAIDKMAGFKPLPFEEQGVWKFKPDGETGPIRFYWICYLNQNQVDEIKTAYDAHDYLTFNSKSKDGIAARIAGNSYVPSPHELVSNPDFSLKSIIRSSRNTKLIVSGTSPEDATSHLLTMELARRIASLDQFDDGRKVATLLTR